MAGNPKWLATLLRPRILTGRHPSTGVFYRLTVKTNGMMTIERTPYISPIDGWKQEYDMLTDEAIKHQSLILTIEQNPADWPK